MTRASPHPPGEPASIDDVLAALDAVLTRSIRRGDRTGYFAALYRTVTAKIKEGIDTGFFDDGERMERLDAVFAGRYLSALDGYAQGQPTTRSWQRSLDAASSTQPIVLQHLVLGTNAHVNLDLGIACAETAPGEQLPTLRLDFDRINEILASLMRSVQDQLGQISPWHRLLDWVGGRTDDEFIRFSLEVARTQAWLFATELATLRRDHWGGPIGARDRRIARLADEILRPGLLTPALLLIRSRESRDVARNIEILRAAPAPDLHAVDARVKAERAVGG